MYMCKYLIIDANSLNRKNFSIYFANSQMPSKNKKCLIGHTTTTTTTKR